VLQHEASQALGQVEEVLVTGVAAEEKQGQGA
jgi:hypothetical protein